MNRKYLGFILVAMVLFTASCSENFKVDAPYKHISVVYGILNIADTAHYVVVEKAFLDENQSALTMAKNPDSIYYPDDQISVVVKQIDAFGNVNNTYNLYRVDLTAEGYPKQSGAFATNPSYAYKFKAPLSDNYIYRIVVTNKVTGYVDSAITGITDSSSNVFSIDAFDDLSSISEGLEFSQTQSYSTMSISGFYQEPNNDTLTFPGYFFQGTIRFRWIDSSASGEKENYADYNLPTVVPTGNATGAHVSNGFTFTANNTSLYSFLKVSLGNAPAGTYRILDSADVFIYAGAYELYAYEERNAIQATGLTGTQVEPNYTNIKGNNVLGIFSTEAKRVGRVKLSNATVDSIKISPELGSAGIIGSTTYRK